MKPPLTAQIASIERELKFRARVYPRFVEQGKMTAAQSKHETECMQAVLETLRKVEAKERLI